MPQRHFCWYELMTTDVDAASAFYGSVVGWKAEDMPMSGMTYTLLKADGALAGGMMPLPQDACDMGVPPCWTGYVHVDDVDGDAARVTSLGGRMHKPPQDIPKVGRFAVVSDPLGAVFNLFCPTPPGGESVHLYFMQPGHAGWHELHSKDWQKVFSFYEAMFGWSRGDAIDMGPLGTYQLFNIGEQSVGGVFNSPGVTQKSFWLYYFAVGNIDAAVERITRGGGKVTNGPMEVPGGAWIVEAADPQGAMFALLGDRKV